MDNLFTMYFTDFVYIWKDFENHFTEAVNPKFIAKHKCVAVPKADLKLAYNSISDFLTDLDNHMKLKKCLDIETISDLKSLKELS